jgi:hypothetical protein
MMTPTLPISATASPIPSAITLRNLAIGGAAGLVLWEVFARVITKAILGYPLEPAGLIDAISNHQFGISVNYWLREAMHYTIGIIGYPLAYFMLSRLVPRWGAVLDVLVLASFTAALALVFAKGGFNASLLGFWLAVAALATWRFWQGGSAVLDALTWGNFTWMNALALMAPLGGLSVYLLGEGGDLSFMSFFGHVMYGAVAVLVFQRLERRPI